MKFDSPLRASGMGFRYRSRHTALAFLVVSAFASLACGSGEGAGNRDRPYEGSDASKPVGSGGDAKEASGIPAGWSILELTPNLGSDAELERISCVADRYCMILAFTKHERGLLQATTVTYADGDIGKPVQVAPYRDTQGASIACSSSSFCMLLTSVSRFYTWDGSSWTVHDEGESEAAREGGTSLTCPADNRCFAVGQSADSALVLEYDGSGWTKQELPRDNVEGVATDISCSSPSDCYLLTNAGQLWRYGGSTWGNPTSPTVTDSQSSEDPIASISCTQGPLCIAAGSVGGGLLVDSGAGFKARSQIEVLHTTVPGSCGSPRFCLVQPMRKDGPPTDYAIFDGSRLSPVNAPPDTIFSISCTSDRFCMGRPLEPAASGPSVFIYNGG